MKEILLQYGLSPDDFTVQPFGNGLINSTWIVESRSLQKRYILQKINQQVFKQPADIAFNIRLIDAYLKIHAPAYLFVSPIKNLEGADMVKSDGAYYRMFPFVTNSKTIDVVEKPEQAYEAAKQFGRFTKLLFGFDARSLKITLPDFHNLSLRYKQFEESLNNGNPERLVQSKELIDEVIAHKHIVATYEKLSSTLQRRCTHHDTKISNVLFDRHDKGLCVIDLDTVMPGYFISDVGDMIRTYVCQVNEEEKDFSRIEIRPAFYQAIIDGYLSEMGEELTDEEKKLFHYAGCFMIYMQALRFLTDHLNNDVYYGAKYIGHNFVRAGNQITLLNRLMAFNPG